MRLTPKCQLGLGGRVKTAYMQSEGSEASSYTYIACQWSSPLIRHHPIYCTFAIWSPRSLNHSLHNNNDAINVCHESCPPPYMGERNPPVLMQQTGSGMLCMLIRKPLSHLAAMAITPSTINPPPSYTPVGEH